MTIMPKEGINWYGVCLTLAFIAVILLFAYYIIWPLTEQMASTPEISSQMPSKYVNLSILNPASSYKLYCQGDTVILINSTARYVSSDWGNTWHEESIIYAI